MANFQYKKIDKIPTCRIMEHKATKISIIPPNDTLSTRVRLFTFFAALCRKKNPISAYNFRV